jgi:hypothetical protein
VQVLDGDDHRVALALLDEEPGDGVERLALDRVGGKLLARVRHRAE